MSDDSEVRDASQSANAIVMLAGWTPTPEVVAIQERVIRDELTHDQAADAHIDQIRAAYRSS